MTPEQTYLDSITRQDKRSNLIYGPLGMNNVGYMDDTTSVDPSNYLASLLGQGAAMFGAGIAGRDPGRVSEGINDMRVFADRMRQAQAQQRQETLLRQQAQEEQRIKNEQLIKNQQEALEFKKQEQEKEKQKLENEALKQSELEKSESNISKIQRYKFGKLYGIDIDQSITAADLQQKEVREALEKMGERKRQEEALAKQQKLLPRGGGGGVRQPKQPKPEKEVKSTQKYVDEYREHVGALSEMSNVIDKIKKLGRTRLGTLTPDFSTDTQAYASTLDRAAQPLIKTLAGPGTLQKEERDTYGKLVPNANTRADLALRQATDIIIEGTGKALSKMNSDLNSGDLSKKDYDSFINQYNEQITKKEMGLGKVINPTNGRLEDREKIERTLKDGKKVITDQYGYVWE